MKEYLSPQEAAEELDISLTELQKFVMSGNLTLYVPDCFGNPDYELYRYTAAQFFTNPDHVLSTDCGLWEADSCPNDCEHRSELLSSEPYRFCGPNVAPVPPEVRNTLLLKQLLIKREDVGDLLLAGQTPQEWILALQIKNLEAAKKYVVNESPKTSKQKISANLVKRFGLKQADAFDLMYPCEAGSTEKGTKQKRIGRLLKDADNS